MVKEVFSKKECVHWILKEPDSDKQRMCERGLEMGWAGYTEALWWAVPTSLLEQMIGASREWLGQ